MSIFEEKKLTNLASWMVQKGCGSTGSNELEKLHPAVYFSRPQQYVRVKLVDNVQGDNVKEVIDPEEVDDNHALVHWDAVFDLNGGRRIEMSAEPVSERKGFYIDCRQDKNMRMEISSETGRIMREFRVLGGLLPWEQEDYYLDPSVLGKHNMTVVKPVEKQTVTMTRNAVLESEKATVTRRATGEAAHAAWMSIPAITKPLREALWKISPALPMLLGIDVGDLGLGGTSAVGKLARKQAWAAADKEVTARAVRRKPGEVAVQKGQLTYCDGGPGAKPQGFFSKLGTSLMGPKCHTRPVPKLTLPIGLDNVVPFKDEAEAFEKGQSGSSKFVDPDEELAALPSKAAVF